MCLLSYFFYINCTYDHGNLGHTSTLFRIFSKKRVTDFLQIRLKANNNLWRGELIVCQGVSVNQNANKRYAVYSGLPLLAILAIVALFGHKPSSEFEKLCLHLKIVPTKLSGWWLLQFNDPCFQTIRHALHTHALGLISINITRVYQSTMHTGSFISSLQMKVYLQTFLQTDYFHIHLTGQMLKTCLEIFKSGMCESNGYGELSVYVRSITIDVIYF